MTPETNFHRMNDAERFDLLLRPEDWPEDPGQQAELAALLELHLALEAHGPDCAQECLPEPKVTWLRHAWLPAAAAAVITLLPAGLAVQHIGNLRTQAKERTRLETAAQQRGQGRLWAAFFQQSSQLLRQFEKNPPVCRDQALDRREDRNSEREFAQVLLQASHQLTAQGAPIPEAEDIRLNLHAWLTELSLEDGCIAPQRVEELRQYASIHKLEDETQRLGQLLQGRDN